MTTVWTYVVDGLTPDGRTAIGYRLTCSPAGYAEPDIREWHERAAVSRLRRECPGVRDVTGIWIPGTFPDEG